MYEKIRKLHFVGIGGIGMSGIAEVLLNLGYQISGSDLIENARIRRLRELGATIHLHHSAENIQGVDVVVHSSAVKADNPEVCAARQHHIPIARRAEMLAELMRLKYGIAIAGTHGKTSTTSMVAALLGEAGMDPTVVNGGIVKAFNSNARLGQGSFLVTEADESDGTFLKLLPTIAVVTNMEAEHMDHYGEFAAVRRAFLGFLERIPFYGLAVICHDDPETKALQSLLPDKRIISYGLTEGADIQASCIHRDNGLNCFSVHRRNPLDGRLSLLGEIALTQPGKHNVLNSLAAIAVAMELDISWEVITRSLRLFKGVRRRFDLLVETPARVIVDDYAHHPTEIRATLAAAREAYGSNRRIVAVFQPHRYSRLQALFEEFLRCFHEADLVLVDQTYSAGEKMPADYFPHDARITLMAGIVKHSQTIAAPLPAGEQWREAMEDFLQFGDVIVFLGAGSITYLARDFAGLPTKET